MLEDRVESGVNFRAVNNCPFEIPPHWVAESGKPVMVFPPPKFGFQNWRVYAPLGGCSSDGLLWLEGERCEERAFTIAAMFSRQKN